jgi:DNA (cytosine-5)-methyltransferase 1
VIVLDGCCGAGGASCGYVDAGHVVYGADIAPQPNYLKSGAAGFLQADILGVLRQPWIARVDFIHVSPPCQRHSKMSNCRPGLAATYPDLVPAVREVLISTGKPYVIEQPEHGAPLIDPITLCGWIFGYKTYRHRCFEAGGGFAIVAPPTPPEGMPGRRMACGWPHPVPAARAGHWEPGKFVSVAGHERVRLTRKVMAIDWTSREELAEAIPPYFTRWIGEQIVGCKRGGHAQRNGRHRLPPQPHLQGGLVP